ncbi:MAG: (2Fe-2S) ferredoxin domain-containing protein [Gammaproteobacteria bacterium]|nr:(2Fe-2S) ferredoxin domain-containing protein [Gammaproteobacteria bacterium]
MSELYNNLNKLAEKTAKLNLPNTKYHIFICCDQTKENESKQCCSKADGLLAWDYLKNRLNELNLTSKCGIQRTKANCLRICTHGPIVVIYPQGVWYHSCMPEVLEQIIQSHIINGQILTEYVLPDIIENK